MALTGAHAPGATPLTEEDIRGLKLAGITTQGELNEAEAQNILRGQEWALRSHTRALSDMLSDKYMLRLHKEMFGDVWKWAGKFRERDTNIGVPSHLIRTSLRELYAEVRGWLEYRAYPPDEIAIRLKYRVVTIHAFSNGNGRHGRMLAHIAMVRHFGCRQEEECSLRWEWEKQMPEFGTSVFVIPGEKVKNSEERLVVLNRIARSAIEEARGMHPVYVFVRRSEDGRTVPVKKMNNTGWRSARERAADNWERVHGTGAPEGFRRVRVHDLKHTFGRRLRAAGVSFEDRQDLLGHKSQRITTHYSHPELSNLIAAAEQACG